MWSTSKRIKRLRRLESTEDEICGEGEDKCVRIGEVQGTQETEKGRVYGNYMIYLLTAIGLKPGSSSTVHIYTQTIHRTT
jgi:hypothetical protein